MKVEIELSELESLKKKLNDVQKEKNQLEEKLKELSESELKSKAVRLAHRLFDSYMTAVFKHLGFGEWEFGSGGKTVVFNNEMLQHELGKDWWNSERLEVVLGAKVTTKFKSAFLQIGIIPDKEFEESKDDVHELI